MLPDNINAPKVPAHVIRRKAGISMDVADRRTRASRIITSSIRAQTRQATHNQPSPSDQPYWNFGFNKSLSAPAETREKMSTRAQAFVATKAHDAPRTAAVSAK